MRYVWYVRLHLVFQYVALAALIAVLAWVVFHPAHKVIVCVKAPGHAIVCAGR